MTRQLSTEEAETPISSAGIESEIQPVSSVKALLDKALVLLMLAILLTLSWPLMSLYAGQMQEGYSSPALQTDFPRLSKPLRVTPHHSNRPEDRDIV